MEWLFLLVPFGVIIYLGIESYRREKQRKQLERQRREEEAEVEEILGGFDAATETKRTLKLLGDTLPNVYRCGRWNCGGTLLKNTRDPTFNHYYCTQCGNFRTTIRKVKLNEWS